MRTLQKVYFSPIDKSIKALPSKVEESYRNFTLLTCLFTKLADSEVWELPDGLFWHFLQKRSTNLAVLKKKFGHF